MTDDTRQKIQDGRYRTEDREVTVWDQVGVGVLVFKRPPVSTHPSCRPADRCYMRHDIKQHKTNNIDNTNNIHPYLSELCAWYGVCEVGRLFAVLS